MVLLQALFSFLWELHAIPSTENPRRSTPVKACVRSVCPVDLGWDCVQWRSHHRVTEGMLLRNVLSRTKHGSNEISTVSVRIARIIMVFLGKIHILITIYLETCYCVKMMWGLREIRKRRRLYEAPCFQLLLPIGFISMISKYFMFTLKWPWLGK